MAHTFKNNFWLFTPSSGSEVGEVGRQRMHEVHSRQTDTAAGQLGWLEGTA